jgi:hypothetical protein
MQGKFIHQKRLVNTNLARERDEANCATDRKCRSTPPHDYNSHVAAQLEHSAWTTTGQPPSKQAMGSSPQAGLSWKCKHDDDDDGMGWAGGTATQSTDRKALKSVECKKDDH